MADLIDRELLLTGMDSVLRSMWQKYATEPYLNKVVGLVQVQRDFVAAQPNIDPSTLRPKGEWISVEDRLPERGQEVIVYRNDCVYSMRFWDEKHPLWQSTSHWMPLPKPPGADMRGET